ncbi:17623_t:CDS:2 [Funneliformis geosporum]|nr:17623_t:CDS:2 [Funneliformis geosporum]
MSRVERRILTDYWCTKIRGELIEELSSLQKSHDDKRQEMNEIYDEGRRRILLASDVIGMTTNGAAKFQALIRSIGPRIIVCEEAGEVLEAHILSALTPSTQHIILIGDPHQLRPNIATYSLNMDSTLGKNYQLNKSLFERLVEGDNSAKIGKVQLLTQRRMRKEISDLVRRTLYPKLIDGENTAKYPNVRGAQYNVYFINHRHPEDSGGDFAMQSHVNKYEVEMVVEMVKYFIRNGYTKSEDIAVLTPYLGQMIKIRDALSKSFVVVIDERDAQKLEEIEEKEDGYDENDNREGKDNTIGSISVASKKSLQQQITLRTVDNFQGEEATIVIISLVRNYSGSGKRDTIGFLRSKNRSNVLLSRARQGMYLLGNSELMASESKDMWAPVIKILDERNQIGDARD